jgi:hypothetical protein
MFQVAIELRAAARTDRELRAALTPIEKLVRERIIHQTGVMLGPAFAGQDGYATALDLTLHLMIGAATTACLHGEQGRADELVAHWRRMFPAIVAAAAAPATKPPARGTDQRARESKR